MKKIKWSNKKFIVKLKKIHKNKYNYSKVNYINSKNKITIICPIHGEFNQRASHHLSGHGCSKCNFLNIGNSKRLTKDEFISDSNKIHNNLYDYSESNYINRNTKLSINCKNHGKFEQTPNAHKRGQGCPKCGLKILSDRFLSTTKEFINKAVLLHKNKYDYSKANYIGSNTKIIIICKKHGKFEQTPNNHLQGKGCSYCSWTISKPEKEFLDFLNVPMRNIRLSKWKQKSVDGYNPKTNTVYEFLGDYWHGNPIVFSKNKINKDNNKKFGELYDTTIKKLEKLKSLGYNVKYIWEYDWNKFKKNENPKPNICDY